MTEVSAKTVIVIELDLTQRLFNILIPFSVSSSQHITSNIKHGLEWIHKSKIKGNFHGNP